MIYALINAGIVTNTILADPPFLKFIEKDYDAIVRIDTLDPVPGIWWTYDGVSFSQGVPPTDPAP